MFSRFTPARCLIGRSTSTPHPSLKGLDKINPIFRRFPTSYIFPGNNEQINPRKLLLAPKTVQKRTEQTELLYLLPNSDEVGITSGSVFFWMDYSSAISDQYSSLDRYKMKIDAAKCPRSANTIQMIDRLMLPSIKFLASYLEEAHWSHSW